MSKIVSIRNSLSSSTPVVTVHTPSASCSWNSFTPVSEDDIRKVISKAPSSSCLLDPLPSWLVKKSVDAILPAITSVINTSLNSGVVPDTLRSAVITPLLKKSNLDHNVLKNYRPVSNLPFLSKVLERVVAKHLSDYMTVNQLHEPRQAAYKCYHSTETDLLKVHNDIMWTMERKGVTILVLLDLSAAFDTFDHNVLFQCMEELLGVHGAPLQWFRSYLSGRTQRVQINGEFSAPQELRFGVPQGSVLGPQLFLIYMLPLGAIIRKHGMEFQMYANDMQIYCSICPVTVDGVSQAVSNIEACVSEVNVWMASNFLKLNADKTEVLVIGFRTQLAKLDLSFMKLADADVAVQSNPIRNLGVMFDTGMTMATQVSNIVKSANFHLVNIGRSRRLLTDDATKLAIHTLVTSRLDYCNSLLIGISLRHQRKLQNIQRTSARLITKRRKFDSITSQLIELH